MSNKVNDNDVGEKIWVKKLCQDIENNSKWNKKYKIKYEVPLPHSISLNNFLRLSEDKMNEYSLVFDMNTTNKEINKNIRKWNVDLLVYEEDAKTGNIIPRVVIEAKYKKINTHDPITYSYKAELHKRLFPGLIYGVIVGNYGFERKKENIYIPTRVIEYGNNFDFIFFFEDNYNEKEIEQFIEILNKNIDISKKLEDFYKKKDRYKYIIKNTDFTKDIGKGKENEK